jgi:hypothetical protein
MRTTACGRARSGILRNGHALIQRHDEWICTCAYGAVLETRSCLVAGGAKQRTGRGNTVDEPVTCLPASLVCTNDIGVGHNDGISSLRSHASVCRDN